MVTFQRVTDTDGNDFAAAMSIYEQSFPSNEKQRIEVLRERIQRGQENLIAGVLEGAVVMMALLWPLAGTRFLLLDYLATAPNYRGMRIASHFLDHIKKDLVSANRHLLLEAEDPAYGNNRTLRAGRVAFYRRNGAKVLKDLRYVLPALDGTHSTEMVLLMLPPPDTIGSPLVSELISKIYGEVYGRSADEILKLNEDLLKDGQVRLV
jgi:ribosomal protein S18 acetylase RimI-like enzyme